MIKENAEARCRPPEQLDAKPSLRRLQGPGRSLHRQRGNVVNIALTIAAFAIMGFYAVTQFTESMDDAGGTAAITEVASIVLKAVNYRMANNHLYTNITLDDIGGSPNDTYGEAVTVAPAGTTAAITYAGIPTAAVCQTILDNIDTLPRMAGTNACDPTTNLLTINLN